MPVVPLADGPSVQPSDAPLGVHPSLDTFGGGESARPVDLTGVTRVASQLYAANTQRANVSAVADKAAQLSALETSILHDPETGALSQRGQNAMSTPDTARAAWEKGAGAVLDQAANADQRDAVQRLIDQHWGNINEAVTRHVASEVDVVQQQHFGALVDAETNAAVANYTDPNRVDQAINTISATLRDQGRALGTDPDATAAEIAKRVSAIDTAVVSRYLANDQTDAAREYYTAHKDGIEGEAQARIDQALKTSTDRGAAQTLADTVLKRATTRTEALAAIKDANPSPEVRQLAEERVSQAMTQRAEDARVQAEQNMTSAGNIIDHTGTITKIPPTMWESFSPSQKGSLKEYADKVQKGEPVITDQTLKYNLRMMAATDPSAFTKYDLSKHLAELAPSDLNELTDLKARIVEHDQATVTKLADFAKTNDIIETSLKQAGVGVLGAGASTTEKKAGDSAAATVKQSVTAEIESEQAQTGKPLTSERVQQITDDVLTKRIVQRPGRFFGTNTDQRRLYEMQPGEQLVLTAKDIPASEAPGIDQAIRAKGLPVTDATRVQYYRAYLSGLVKRGPQ